MFKLPKFQTNHKAMNIILINDFQLKKRIVKQYLMICLANLFGPTCPKKTYIMTMCHRDYTF